MDATITKIHPEKKHNNYRRTWIWAVPLLVLLFSTGGQLIVLVPAKILGLITRETVETYPTVLYLIVGCFAVIALLFALWIRLFERRDMASVGLTLSHGSLGHFAGGYGSGILTGSAVVFSVLLLGGYEIESGTGSRSLDLMPIFILMLAFILQSGTEELVFRGWMMGRISERYGTWAGIIANSLLFAFMHVDPSSFGSSPLVMTVIFTLATLLFSIFLSLLVIRQKSILGAAAWHAAWNWIFITWFGLPTTGIELGLSPLVTDLSPVEGKAEWLTGGATGPEGSVMTLVVLAAGCGVLLLRGAFRSRSRQAWTRGCQSQTACNYSAGD